MERTHARPGHTKALAAGLVATGLLLGGCTTSPESRSDISTSARNALQDLYQTEPTAKSVADRSQAILVFPSVTQAGLGIGGQYGRGVMFRNGEPVGYYNITGGSVGFQIGAQNFSQAYFFTSEKALETFRKSKGFEVGAGLDVAVASKGVSGDISSSTLQKPLVAFVWGQEGLMAGIKIEGQKITELKREQAG